MFTVSLQKCRPKSEFTQLEEDECKWMLSFMLFIYESNEPYS